jgi:1-acyl-sn-glycerol-3-phosphate acyltransferase
MLPFRSGAFRMAAETGSQILPIAVSGTREAIRKGSWMFGRADVVVRILDPVPVPEGSDEERQELVNRIRDQTREAIQVARSASPEDLAQAVDRDRL